MSTSVDPLLFNGVLIFTGEFVRSDQYNDFAIVAEVNITMIPAQHRDAVMMFFIDENVTVTDGLANISREFLCSNAVATSIRAILTAATSVEISCAECGTSEA